MNKKNLYSIIATLFLLCGCFISNDNSFEIRNGFVHFHENSGIQLTFEVIDASGNLVLSDVLIMRNDQKCDSVSILSMADCFEGMSDGSLMGFPVDSFSGKTIKICNYTHGDRGMQCRSYTVPPPPQNP